MRTRSTSRIESQAEPIQSPPRKQPKAASVTKSPSATAVEVLVETPQKSREPTRATPNTSPTRKAPNVPTSDIVGRDNTGAVVEIPLTPTSRRALWVNPQQSGDNVPSSKLFPPESSADVFESVSAGSYTSPSKSSTRTPSTTTPAQVSDFIQSSLYRTSNLRLRAKLLRMYTQSDNPPSLAYAEDMSEEEYLKMHLEDADGVFLRKLKGLCVGLGISYEDALRELYFHSGDWNAARLALSESSSAAALHSRWSELEDQVLLTSSADESLLDVMLIKGPHNFWERLRFLHRYYQEELTPAPTSLAPSSSFEVTPDQFSDIMEYVTTLKYLQTDDFIRKVNPTSNTTNGF
ncbi:hypothetical protein IWQ62_002556 [Dispira parvispora]|uniref:Uncharacterized protein n=1 Tax=Dispira parvispora TaxID=1520584 RepID=A0A9W8AWH1_9FUNG|nr:hypothetical protein IWQ62_002556 [Dispira parvispora]